MTTTLQPILNGAATPFQGRFETNTTDGGQVPHFVIEIAGGNGSVVGQNNPLPISVPNPGLGTDASYNAITPGTALVSGTVTNPGHLYVQNQSANAVEIVLGPSNNQTVILLASGVPSGSSAPGQGADWSAAQSMPWFTGPFTINGTAGSQVAVRHN